MKPTVSFLARRTSSRCVALFVIVCCLASPAGAFTFTLSTSQVRGGKDVTASVALEASERTAGWSVTLSTNSGAVEQPTEVTLRTGQNPLRAVFHTRAVEGPTPVEIMAVCSCSPVPITRTFTVLPGAQSVAPVAAPVSGSSSPPGSAGAPWLVLERPSVAGGSDVMATVTLSEPAPAGGMSFAVGANVMAGWREPAPEVVVPAGATSASFVVHTAHEGQMVKLPVWIRWGSNTREALLTVTPVGIAEVVCSTSQVKAGEPVYGLVRLDGAAPEGGLDIRLAVQPTTGVVTLPQGTSLRIPAGSTSRAFKINTSNAPLTGAAMNGTVSASGNGSTKSASFKIVKQ